jgi:threonine/homoserine/homoserine lactone efflux protein
VQSLLAAARRRSSHHPAGARSTPGGSLRQGLVSNLANPKMAVFFTSLLPQFGTAFATLLALVFLFSLLTGIWLAAYAVAAARARRLLARDRVRRAFEAVTGVVLVALGLRVAAARG